MTESAAPTLLQEDEEVLGDPSFELLVRNGEPVVSGSYFIHPPLRAVSAQWDDAGRDRINVVADDGTEWFVDNVPREGSLSVVLQPVQGHHPAYLEPAGD